MKSFIFCKKENICLTTTFLNRKKKNINSKSCNKSVLVSYCFYAFFFCILLMIFFKSESLLLFPQWFIRRGFSDEGGASQAPAFLTPMSQSECRKQSWPYKKGGEFGKIIILQNGILSTMCAWARSSIFWNWERLTTRCLWFRAVWLDDVQESVGMAVLGLCWSTAKTRPICSTQLYGTVLHVSRNLFSFCFCFYLWWCFVLFFFLFFFRFI